MNDPSDPSDPTLGKVAPADPQQRGSLLGFVAHEMRNPLSTALWSAELLVRLAPEERAGARGEKLSGMCLRSLQRLRTLMEDHFLADRLAVAGVPVRRESIAPAELLEAVRTKSGVADVKLDVPADLWAWSDRNLTERALEGLLAVSGRGGAAVLVTGVADGGMVTLRFRGAPPAPDALAMPQKGTPSDPSGRALSLHMSVHVAASLGGQLSATPEELVLQLPISTTPPAARDDA